MHPTGGSAARVAGSVDVPIGPAGSYQFAVRSKGQAWRSVDVQSPVKTVARGLGLVYYGCS